MIQREEGEFGALLLMGDGDLGGLAMHVADHRFGAAQRLEGYIAQGNDHLRLHQQDLLHQVGREQRQLLLARRTVRHPALVAHLGRADLHHIADVYVLPVELQHLQKAVQVFACLAYEGSPLEGFLLAGSLADEHHRRMVALALTQDDGLFLRRPEGLKKTEHFIVEGLHFALR